MISQRYIQKLLCLIFFALSNCKCFTLFSQTGTNQNIHILQRKITKYKYEKKRNTIAVHNFSWTFFIILKCHKMYLSYTFSHNNISQYLEVCSERLIINWRWLHFMRLVVVRRSTKSILCFLVVHNQIQIWFFDLVT